MKSSEEETPLIKAKSRTGPSPLVWVLLAAVVFGGTAFYIKVSKFMPEAPAARIRVKVQKDSPEMSKDRSSRKHPSDAAGATSQNATCDAATISKVFQPPPGIAQEFRKTVQDVASSYVLIAFSHHHSEIFRNFIAHAQKIQDESGSFPTIVSVNTDTGSQTACESVGWHNLKCFNGAGWLPMDYNSVPVAFGTCSYTLLTFLKPAALKIALTALHPDSAVLYTDTDVVWYKNAMSLVSSMAGDADFLCRDENAVPNKNVFSPTVCNGGFIFAKRSSAPLIDKWIENSVSDKFNQTTGTHGDQDPLNVVLSSGEFQSHVKQIDSRLIGHCGTSGTMARHYTCANGDKIGQMKRAGDWLVS